VILRMRRQHIEHAGYVDLIRNIREVEVDIYGGLALQVLGLYTSK
jgi:hypothetical protein